MTIPYGRQDITQDDIDAVTMVLRSDFLTQGPVLPEFERTVAEKVNVGHGVAVNSATSALHIACLALGLGPGDLLWTSPITFVASANCALYCGAEVDFVDIDPLTYNMSPEQLKIKLGEAERRGRLPKVIVPVHMGGQSCDMAAIRSLTEKFGIKIIEDASHAVGGFWYGKPIGSCEYSDITVFSFHPVKIITTGEGGMAVTNDAKLARKMESLRSHGITRDAEMMVHEPDGPWYYEQLELGYNYRMTDIQAALGLSQIMRIDDYVACRHDQAHRYDQALADLPLHTPWQHPDSYSAFHLYIIRLTDQSVHGTVFEQLRRRGIGVNLHYIPVHLQPYYRRMGFVPGSFPEAEAYYSQAISLPLFPKMTEVQQDRVVMALREVL